jgi:hypothetical protein
VALLASTPERLSAVQSVSATGLSDAEALRVASGEHDPFRNEAKGIADPEEALEVEVRDVIGDDLDRDSSARARVGDHPRGDESWSVLEVKSPADPSGFVTLETGLDDRAMVGGGGGCPHVRVRHPFHRCRPSRLGHVSGEAGGVPRGLGETKRAEISPPPVTRIVWCSGS